MAGHQHRAQTALSAQSALTITLVLSIAMTSTAARAWRWREHLIRAGRVDSRK